MAATTIKALPNPDNDLDHFRLRVDEYHSQADELERKINQVVQYYNKKKQGNNAKGSSGGKDREKEKLAATNNTNNATNVSVANNNNSGSNSGGKKPLDVPRKDVAACTKRMQDLMRQFGTILKQISQHKWAWPFMEPVDVEGLGLDDYYKVIKKPMDFTTIKNQIEGNGYKHVRDIYADVRLVFSNAMTYNDDQSDVHVMAKTLLEKFEERWLQLLPKVVDEETRQKEEEVTTVVNVQTAQEATFSKMAKEANSELDELNMQLDQLRETVIQRCRKMSTEEKRKLGVGLSTLSPEDLNKALDIIAQNNPNFQATAEVVNLDMDAQTESTLWKLKLFVKGALELQAKNSATKADDNSKRKKEICDALAKTAKKRNKKLTS